MTGTPDQDIALFEVLLEETTSYQPQPELSIKDREELVSEVSGDLMQPGAIDPNVADEGLLVPAGADGGSPHMMRIASGAAAFFFFQFLISCITGNPATWMEDMGTRLWLWFVRLGSVEC